MGYTFKLFYIIIFFFSVHVRSQVGNFRSLLMNGSERFSLESVLLKNSII